MKKIISKIGWSSLAFLFPVFSLAAASVPTITAVGEGGTGDLAVKVVKIINYVLGIVGVIAFIVIVYGAFKIMTGGEEGVKEGKTIITYGIVGIVIAILAMSVANFLVGALSAT